MTQILGDLDISWLSTWENSSVVFGQGEDTALPVVRSTGQLVNCVSVEKWDKERWEKGRKGVQYPVCLLDFPIF